MAVPAYIQEALKACRSTPSDEGACEQVKEYIELTQPADIARISAESDFKEALETAKEQIAKCRRDKEACKEAETLFHTAQAKYGILKNYLDDTDLSQSYERELVWQEGVLRQRQEHIVPELAFDETYSAAKNEVDACSSEKKACTGAGLLLVTAHRQWRAWALARKGTEIKPRDEIAEGELTKCPENSQLPHPIWRMAIGFCFSGKVDPSELQRLQIGSGALMAYEKALRDKTE